MPLEDAGFDHVRGGARQARVKDAAFARLEEAYRTKAPRLRALKASWEFAPLRSDPRWSELVHRLKLG